jgi:polar amino acid transport system permease protein
MNWDWNYAWHLLPVLGQGLVVTVEVTAAAALISVVVGFVLAIIRRAGGPLGGLVAFIIEFLRGTPLLIQAFFLFYVAPLYGITLSPFVTGAIALGAYYSAYTAEAYRGGIASIPVGQWEAASVLSLSPTRTWIGIIGPQAVRAVLPALGNYIIGMLKDSAILSVITVSELLNQAQSAGALSYRYLEPFTLVGVLYFAISYPSSIGVRRLERRLGRRLSSTHR